MASKLGLMLIGAMVFVPEMHGQTVDWSVVLNGVERKVPRVEMVTEKADDGICSAVVYRINPADKSALALTAAHCVSKPQTQRLDVTVNRRHAEVIVYNTLLDLAVLQFQAKNEEAITFAPSAPPKGAPVSVLGYGFGIEELAAQFGHISQTWNKETKSIWIDAELLFGDSGGPVIDAQGRLVGINSRIYTAVPTKMGAAVSIEDVKDFVEVADKRLKK